jgi:hypothetical protein
LQENIQSTSTRWLLHAASVADWGGGRRILSISKGRYCQGNENTCYKN